MNIPEKCELIREQVSIVAYAESCGFTLVRKGKYWSLKEHDSVIIDTNRNIYWQNSVPGSGTCIGKQGTVIDFAMDFCHLSFREAVSVLSSNLLFQNCRRPQKESRKIPSSGKKKLMLPPADNNMKKVFAYLIKTRKIAKEIVQEMMERKMLYQDQLGNCVFVGYDILNPDQPVFACKRGTNTYKKFAGDVAGCDYAQCFYVDNGSRTLVVAEAVIDALSIMTLCLNHHTEYNYLALGGAGKWQSIKTYLDTGKINRVMIATDNDTAGKETAKMIWDWVEENHQEIKKAKVLPPEKMGKDWNDVLQALNKRGA